MVELEIVAIISRQKEKNTPKPTPNAKDYGKKKNKIKKPNTKLLENLMV